MRFLEFKNIISPFTVFSIKDIRKIDPAFHFQRLDEWQKKGYIKKIINKYYILSDVKIDENILYYISNKIYEPSYISLESAFNYYGIIPESVYKITSVSTKRTYNFKSEIGEFVYRKIKPLLYFGFIIINAGNNKIKIANIEKCILDFLYLNPDYKTLDDFYELRFNKEKIIELFDENEFMTYLEIFKNIQLDKRAIKFLKFVNND